MTDLRIAKGLALVAADQEAQEGTDDPDFRLGSRLGPLGARGLPRERGAVKRSNLTREAKGKARRRAGIGAASKAQREKVQAPSIVSGRSPCDPAHVWPRGRGGCSAPICVVPLTRDEHRLYDERKLDLLPYLLRAGCIAELQHALAHADGNLLALLHMVTGQRHVPLETA